MSTSLAVVQDGFLDAVLDSRGAALSPGMEVYRRTVRANLAGALSATYPVVLRLVGRAFFDEAAARYACSNTSRSGDLHDYGAHFGAFLEVYEPARGLDYLPDVARLEWACHESGHSADAPSFDFEALRRVSPERMGDVRFELHPAVRLLRSLHPVAAIWQANQALHDGTPERLDGPDYVLVRREGLEVRVEAVDAAEWTLLAGFAAGAPLAAASAPLAPEDAQRVLSTSLARFVRDNTVCAFSLADAIA